jgi:hypothetical protein
MLIPTLIGFVCWVFLAPFFGAYPICYTPASVNRTRLVQKWLAHGFRHHLQEYGQLPPQVFSQKMDLDTHLTTRGPWLKDLFQYIPVNAQYPFFVDAPETRDGKGGYYEKDGEWRLVDGWGNPFHLIVDTNKDQRIQNPVSAPLEWIEKRILIYSAGPDGDPETWEDNIRSW